MEKLKRVPEIIEHLTNNMENWRNLDSFHIQNFLKFFAAERAKSKTNADKSERENEVHQQ
jgi:hypothetical protein